MSKKSNSTCSFCGRERKDVSVLIAGIEGHICENCVEQANDIISQDLKVELEIDLQEDIKFLKPMEIKTRLDEYIIGQEDAKKILSVAVYNHYKRLLNPGSDSEEIELEKSNILLVGRTGTGKTLLAKTIAKMLNVPFTIADATVFTQAGYVGEDVESLLTRLLQAADYDVEAAQKGIVFLDEIDKIGRKGDSPSITRDVTSEGTQQALLKLLEGTDVRVPPQGGRKHPDQKMVEIDTRNILFISGGAFDGIERIIERRIKTQPLGFGTKGEDVGEDNLLEYLSPQDVKSFGLIPELIGRFPILSHLNPLDRDALKRILTEPKNALVKQYTKLFELDNVQLSFDKKALDFIVTKAEEYKLGARGLRSICEAVLTDAMFEIPSKKEITKLKITEAYAKSKFDKSKLSKLKVAS
ncbi:ATP-dependent Clp protease ATP-binding subunit ClpX [Flavobacteriales bacterium]|jgi:ATP-dependent Clp protease ATP-binding subunit ClpX|nr:ATP-dependent Clp protease ATP-binding subunit ClpX [Flavobacteriales bacterium]MDB9932805.1 ATP-dependent Clp protease ATP-binding subunit ClpX [Flavobacteriales bacterium]MDG1174396.1 ATP-dependent Clp protease ATP-binding subunit ClpX [Flavobacteriales bacterium]